MPKSIPLTAAQGMDTEDFLEHIAWTDVIKPKFLEAKSILTKRLVASVLEPAQSGGESREQIAGKLWGIDYAIKEIETIVREGRSAKQIMRQHDIDLQ
jgi:hypothetical protein